MMDGGSLERRVLRLMDRRLPWARRGRWVAAGCCVVVLGATSLGVGMLGVRTSAAQIAEPPPVAAVAFEVASVRMVPPGHGGLTTTSPYGGAQFVVTNATLSTLLQIAYGVNDPNLILGKPEWDGNQLYDITAKIEGAGGLTYAQTRPLLQRLLAERFHLTVHHESREVAGYELTVAKGGPKLTETKGAGDARQNGIGRDGLRFQNLSVKGFAATLAYPAGRPVVDKTGISGNYDFKLSYAPEGAVDSPLPSLFVAIEEQLGLKLVAAKVPIDALAIDHVERVPVEN